MRFHIGFSKFISPAKLIKWLALIFFGLLAFFGIDKYLVHALEPSIGSASDYSSVVDHASSHSNWTTENGKRTINFSIPYGANVNRGYIVLIVSNTIACPNGGTVSGSFYWDMTASNYVKYDYDIFDGQTGGLTFGLQSATNGNGYEYNGTATHSYSYADGNLIQFTSFLNSGFTGLRLAFTNTTLHDLATATVYYKLVPLSLSVQCYESNDDIIINNNQNTQDIINNNNDNTQDIIDNQNQNTQDIIDNQNANLQEQIESQQVCNTDNYNLTIDNAVILDKYLNSSGEEEDNRESFGISNYIKVFKGDLVIINSRGTMNAASFCFYDTSKTIISCQRYDRQTNISVPITSDGFARFSILSGVTTSVSIHYCRNGNQAISDSLSDDNVNGATNTGNQFFDTSINDHGIAQIVTSPIRLLQAVINSNSSCTNLPLTINMGSSELTKNVSIPSGCILWDNVPNAVKLVYWTTIFGLLIYYVLIDLFHFVDDLRDPDKKNSYTLDL